MQDKPIVHFRGEVSFHYGEWEGIEWQYARVWALDHPVLGEGDVRTSQIIHRFEDGSFETRNTIYKPEVQA